MVMSEYKKKLVSTEEVAALVKDGMWIDYGVIQSPKEFDRVLARRVNELKGVKIRMIGTLGYPEVMEKDPEGKAFWLGNWHILGLTRKYLKEGRANYIPMNFGEAPRYYREDCDVDIAVQTVTPMDAHGYFNFGSNIAFAKAAMDKAKIRVVEVNESVPWVYGGYDECIHISEVDYVIENKKDKIVEIPSPSPTEEDTKIAEYIAEHVPLDGPCLQIGIGGLPDQLLRLLGQMGARDIGMHTEMVTEAVEELADAGVITGRKKTFMPGKIVHTFAIGSRKLYDWMDRNPMLAGFPVDFTNDPCIVAMNENMISINAALAVDLQGQVSSESIGLDSFSGTGGQLAFARGAYYRSTRGQSPLGYPENKSFIALHSAYNDKEGKLQSRIVPTLRPGEIVTTPRTDVSYLATEYGVTYLKGLSIPERCLALIKIAHPDFRDWLTEEAGKMGWLPKMWALGVMKL
jgi:acyl-CoA hydrolase